METLDAALGKLELFFGGATVFSALILLGYLLFGVASVSTTALALGVVILLLASVIGIGTWFDVWWARLAAWPATLVLLVLGFLGIAIGPQIITVAAFGLLAAAVMSIRDFTDLA